MHRKCIYNHFKFEKYKDIECKLCQNIITINDHFINTNSKLIMKYYKKIKEYKITNLVGVNFLITNLYFFFNLNPFFLFFLIYYLPFVINIYYIK